MGKPNSWVKHEDVMRMLLHPLSSGFQVEFYVDMYGSSEYRGGLKDERITLLGTNISHHKALLKMRFLVPGWDMLVPWRVFQKLCAFANNFKTGKATAASIAGM